MQISPITKGFLVAGASAAGATALSELVLSYPHLSRNASGARIAEWGVGGAATLTTFVCSVPTTEAGHMVQMRLFTDLRRNMVGATVGIPMGVFAAQSALNVLREHGTPAVHVSQR